MNKAILVIDMPKCCDECFALDDNGDYPVCLVTQEQRGYTFNIRDQRMDKCPIKPAPRKYSIDYLMDDVDMCGAISWNACIDEILGETE
jgi:hypothetical protein